MEDIFSLKHGTNMSNVVKIIEIVNLPLEIIEEQVIIEYKDIKLIHLVKSNGIVVVSTDYMSYHILRLIINKLNLTYDTWIKSKYEIGKNILLDYFMKLKEILDTNFFDYCTICGKMHDKVGLSYISTCENIICVNKSYHYPINNKITEFYKSDPTTMFLLFRTMLSCMNHPKIDVILSSLPKIHGIRTFKQLISSIPNKLMGNKLEDLTAIISESYDDFYLWTKLDDNLTYALLINSLSDNYYSMYSYKDLVTTDLKKKNMSEENEIEYFNINYSTEIENDIRSKLDGDKKYYHLYHGSPFHCWYSIIKNGLKVMSGTSLMTTGAAYGNGIYLSDHLAVSLSYARDTVNFKYNMIGVFQVLENPAQYLKTHNIFVVPTEKILILRTLIKINKLATDYNHIGGINTFTILDNYFIRQRTTEKSINDINLVALKNKRLSAELKLIEKFSEKFKVTFYSDEETIPWNVDLYIREKIHKIEIHFHNYPLSPPLFKMANFKYVPRGIINSKFIINLPILEIGNWSIANKLVEVLNLIWTFFSSTDFFM
jgi:ubiquitin-protein ligase